jgi:hypothetical protein
MFSIYFLVSLFLGSPLLGKAIVSILVWIPVSFGMVFAYYLTAFLVYGGSKVETSALHGALELVGADALYAGFGYALMRWVGRDGNAEPSASRAPSSWLPSSGPLGNCPKCKAIIQMSSSECPRCKAVFGPGSEWQVRAPGAGN